MPFAETLKKNHTLRQFVKKLKIYREYLCDASDFSAHYLEAAENNGDYRYRLMLLIHNIEKGMCRQNLRPFGKDKVIQMISILKDYPEERKSEFEYILAVDTLKKWMLFYEMKGWSFYGVSCEAIEFISSLTGSEQEAGYIDYQKPEFELATSSFDKIIFSRRSVRDFENKKLSDEDIKYALRCFIEAPTACNRQMCKVYCINNPKLRELLKSIILGVGGFNTDSMTYFLITYDLSAFEFYGERNQGYVNVGLTAMNFANGLHARGIGSCFMQWSNRREDDKRVRTALGLRESERIGLFLGAGYYKPSSVIPVSRRKSIDQVFAEL